MRCLIAKIGPATFSIVKANHSIGTLVERLLRFTTYRHQGERSHRSGRCRSADHRALRSAGLDRGRGCRRAYRTRPAAAFRVPLSQVTLEAPIPRPAHNVFCVGKNYDAHAAEFAASGFDSSAAAGFVPQHPIIVSKLPESAIAHHAAVMIDQAVSTAIDHEAESAVIIGIGGRAIPHVDAMRHVRGYRIVSHVTVLDLQGKYSRRLIGKSETFARWVLGRHGDHKAPLAAIARATVASCDAFRAIGPPLQGSA